MSAYERYQELQRYVGWTDEDASRVHSIRSLVTPYYGPLVDDFYAEIENHPNARKVITGGDEQIARLKKSLHRWLDELLSGRYDREISAGTAAIVVTAYASSDTAKSVISAGASRIVPKPVNIGNLLGFVAQSLDAPLVLVVDDDQDLCENLWEIFHERGYRVCLAFDTPEAEKKLSDRKFQVVLIDMKLPTGSGHELLRTLRRIDEEARAVLITGYTGEMEAKVNQALDSGANAVCYKPFDVEKLLATVHELSARDSAAT